MSLRDYSWKYAYHSPEENVASDFYIPALKECKKYQRAVGFFSSTALLELSEGLCGLVENDGHVQLIASPQLSAEDVEAIVAGQEDRNAIVERCLVDSLEMLDGEFAEERLNFLANLISHGYMEIKFALMDTGESIGIFHDKQGLLIDDENNVIAISGSSNESISALRYNAESIDVFCSWTSDCERVKEKQERFESIWNNNNPVVEVIELPRVTKSILDKYRKNDTIDLTIDLRQFSAKRISHQNNNSLLTIPKGKTLFPYQDEAIQSWKEHNFCGIFDMATGTGKTYTALGALSEFERHYHNFGALIVCPYIHLVDQWAEDLEEWGVSPIVAHSQSHDKNWKDKLITAYKRFRDTGKPFICATTNDTFSSEVIQSIINNINAQLNFVLIVDEVHNFGAKNLARLMPENIIFRLGLSATVERYMDEEGTTHIFEYFGEKCIELPLRRAIDEGALVPYEYYPILVYLDNDELNRYHSLTKQLSKYIYEDKNGKIVVTDQGQTIMFKRSRLVAGARNKLSVLEKVLEPYKKEHHILVYCGATQVEGVSNAFENNRQIDLVDHLISEKLEMTVHRFTAEEDLRTRRIIKNGFSSGDFQVITAIKCLDEGVNIPNIQKAFILASSRNPKEFIQRRGRVLRNSPGKNQATIFDFVTLPRPLAEVGFGDLRDDESLVLGELMRVNEFGRNALNSHKAFECIDMIEDAYHLSYSYDELFERMMNGYGDSSED